VIISTLKILCVSCDDLHNTSFEANVGTTVL